MTVSLDNAEWSGLEWVTLSLALSVWEGFLFLLSNSMVFVAKDCIIDILCQNKNNLFDWRKGFYSILSLLKRKTLEVKYDN